MCAIRRPWWKVAFITNKDDDASWRTTEYRQQMAVAISEGIMRYRESLQQERTPLAVDLSGE